MRHFKYCKGKQESKETQNTFFHLIMLLLRSHREFDGVWGFSYQRIGPKCGEPRTKGKLSPQSSSKTGGKSSSPCLPSISNHWLAESTSVWMKLARPGPACPVWCLLLKSPSVAKKHSVWGVSRGTWHERNVNVDDVWCQRNNQTSEEMFSNVPRVVGARALRCAAPLPSLRALPLRLREGFFFLEGGGGSVITGRAAAHRKGSALPSAQVVCCSC